MRFSSDNTKEIKEDKIINTINKVKYEPRRCGHNAKRMYEELKQAGISVDIFFGELFYDSSDPEKHAWVVYNESVIDLSDCIDDLVAYYNKIVATKCTAQEIRHKLGEYNDNLSGKVLKDYNSHIGKLSHKYVLVGEKITYNHLCEILEKRIIN